MTKKRGASQQHHPAGAPERPPETAPETQTQTQTQPQTKPQSVRELTITGYVATGIVIVFVLLLNFCFDGCGVSRVSSYFSHYHGSAGYSHLAVVGNLHAIGEPPDSLWNNLHYGSRLSQVKEASIDIIRSEVPAGELEHLFIPESLVDKVQPGGTYCFHVSHVGNYYTFLLRDRYGFEAYRVHEISEQELPTIKLDAKWAAPFRIYSLCAILLPVLFLLAGGRMLIVASVGDPSRLPARDGSPQYRARLRRLLGAIPFVLLYLGAAAYIARLDWVDREWPIGKTLCALLLVGTFFWVLCKKPEPATAA